MKFIKVYTTDGSCWNVSYQYWEALLQAYEAFQLNGTIRVLELTAPEGSTIILSSARIADFTESTPAARKRVAEITKEIQAELGYCDNDTAR